MALTRWNPSREVERVWSDFDRLFNRLTNNNWLSESENDVSEYGTWRPAIDITEHENEYVVGAEVPGMNEDDIQISLKDNVLTLRGEKKFEKEEEGENRYYRERHYGTFQRLIRLDSDVDSDSVNAEYDHGVLTITLPKTKETMAKQIPVNAKKKK